MVDEVPLNPVFQPGEYQCSFRLEGLDGQQHQLDGTVILEPSKPIRGSIQDSGLGEVFDLDLSLGAGFPQRRIYPTVSANMGTSQGILLLAVTVVLAWPNRASVFAHMAVAPPSDINEHGEPVAHGIQVQIAALDALGSDPPIHSFSLPRPEEPEVLRLKLNREDLRWAAGGVDLRMSYRMWISPGPYAFTVKSSPVLELTSETALTIDRWWIDWIEPLRRVVALTTRQDPTLTYFTLLHGTSETDGYRSRSQVFAYDITQAPYAAAQGPDPGQLPAAVHLLQDGVSLLDLASRWRTLERDGHPLIQTYGPLLNEPDPHPRSRFLLLIQALEGLHGHETRRQAGERQDRHTERRTRAVAALATSGLDSQTRRFIKQNLLRSPLSRLADALHALLDSLPGDQIATVSNTPLVQDVIAEGIRTDPLDALADVRNKLAHGVRNYPAHQLSDVVSILEDVVRAHALRILGCPPPAVARALRVL